MKFNPNNLLGKTYPITTLNIGNYIQSDILGIGVNASNKSDGKFWEIKTRNLEAKSALTLGSLKCDGVNDDLISQVYNKCKNLLVIDYKVNSDKTFTIINVSWFIGLTVQSIKSAIAERIIIIDIRKDSTSNYQYSYTFTGLRIYPKNLSSLYKYKVVK